MPTYQITGPDGKKYRVTGETPEGAMQSLRKLNARASTPQGHQNVPEFIPLGVEGYDPKTGEVTPQIGKLRSAAYGAADTATLGFGDEIASTLGSVITGAPRHQVLSEMRGLDTQAQKQNPGSYLAGQITGGVAQGLATGPGIMASAPTLGGRVLGGMATGGALGGTYGAGSGESIQDRAVQSIGNALIGGPAGAAFPLIGAGASRLYEAGRNALAAQPIARQAGASPEALRMLGNVMDADGSLGRRGAVNMARAGSDAMLADAGPNARAVLDTSIQRGGPGAIVARDAISGRTARAAQSVTSALDSTLGQPQGVTATRTAIREASAPSRSSAYGRAYAQAIDYADPRAMRMENMIRRRVPPSVIEHANALMRVNDEESAQILARVADDGSVAFERLPDVRQIDYITRALNDLAEAGEGSGALGGQNALGRAYQNLSREIRDTLKGLVPEYGRALETAADPIRRSKAVELGSKLLSPSMTRDQVAEAVDGMSRAERQALAQGIRSQIDDAMARVTRTVQDGDVDAREAIKAIKDLSSRANREKLALAIGDQPAARLFDEVDRLAMSFDLRASVAENSKTYARLATDQRVKDITQPGVIGTAAQGKPLNAAQRIAQAITGQTPERIKGREDAVYSELARLLTRQGGAGHDVYNAIQQLGQTDAATRMMMDRIVSGLSGPRLSYPSTALAGNSLPYRKDR